jgi:hypothetical protein
MHVLESTIEAAVLRWARQVGLMVTKLQGIGNRSWPDRIFWIPGGRPFLIEFKRPGGRLSELQAITISNLKAAGYDVEVHDDKTKAISALRTRMEAAAVPTTRREVPDKPGRGRRPR